MAGIRRPGSCRKGAGCLDYRKFIFDIDSRPGGEDYQALNRSLLCLGELQSEHLGISRIGSDWGFLIAPPPGFPELSVSFFRHVDDQRISELLEQIDGLIRQHHIRME